MEEGTRWSIQRERHQGGKIKAEKKSQNKSLFHFPKITIRVCARVCVCVVLIKFIPLRVTMLQCFSQESEIIL